MSGQPEPASAVLLAYAAGAIVLYQWARARQRRHGLDERRAALQSASRGGGCGLLIGGADQMDVLGL